MAVDGPTVLAHVELARRVCKYITSSPRLWLKNFVADRQIAITNLAREINQPCLIEHIRQFLYDQLYPDSNLPSSSVSLNACLTFLGKVSTILSAVTTYYAPSDPSGIGGMHREHIWSTCSWWRGSAHYDCVFVESHPELEGMHGLDVVRVLLPFCSHLAALHIHVPSYAGSQSLVRSVIQIQECGWFNQQWPKMGCQMSQ